MTLTIVLVLCAAVALGVIMRITLLRIAPRPVAGLQPIDIEAFRNLIDTDEDEYLRQRLQASEFRAVHSARLRATAAYIRAASENAAVLVHVGQSAITAKDAATAEAARQLVDSALMLRRNATIALVRVYVALAWPTSGPAAGTILRGYEQLSGSAMLLGRLQNPQTPVRL